MTTSAMKPLTDEYDVIIVGGGPAGLFAAFYLSEHSDLRVLLIDKGKAPLRRKCPMKSKDACQHCKPCNILCGIGGAGLFSDGKLNYIYKLGKTDLSQFLSKDAAQELIDETEMIFNRFGMDGPVYPTDMAAAQAVRKTAKRNGIDLLIIKQKHLGSDRLPDYIADMAEAIRFRGVIMHTSEDVRDIMVADGRVTGVITNRKNYTAAHVILAPGRAGANWMGQLAAKYKLGLSQRGIEVGVRVEVHNDILQDLCRIIYDPTFFIQTEKYDDQTRTFCTNRGGYVAMENYSRFVCVNGHAYQDRKSENTNFAFFVQSGAYRTCYRQPGLRRVHRSAGYVDRRRQADPAAVRRSKTGASQHMAPHPQGIHHPHPHECGLRRYCHGPSRTDFNQPFRRP